jgi:CDP-diacylglycerol--serine O-phosphatidyltransferase
MWLKNNVPNLITSMNLLCGTMAVMAVANHEPDVAGLFIFVAAVFDFLDGMAARILNSKTEIGKQLDSLADMVSFGLAPGLIMFDLISKSAELRFPGSTLATNLPYIALMIPVLSAWRLAKFNIDDRQTNHFIGLPTPAYAMVVASFPMIVLYHVNFEASWMMKIISLIYNPIFLAVFSGLFSILLVAPIHLFALKFKHFRWKHNEVRYSFLLVSLILLIWLLLLAIPLIIILYILLSVIIRKTIHSEEAEG